MSDKLKPKSNYSKAVDSKTLLPDWMIEKIDWLNDKKGWNIPTGASNCTLSATQYINPKNPISRAKTIIDNGDYYGYYKVNNPKPNDLIIAENPKLHNYHTMILRGFAAKPTRFNYLGKSYNVPQNEPIVTYSTGTTQESGIRDNIPLISYIDNSHGKTNLHYYRYIPPIELSEITVTPK